MKRPALQTIRHSTKHRSADSRRRLSRGLMFAAAVALLGRPLPLVWLLHASALNADSIGALAKIMRQQRLSAITLDAALADPAYAQPDDYAGPDGNEWLERWSETLHRELPWPTMPHVPKDIAVASAALDHEPGEHGTP